MSAQSWRSHLWPSSRREGWLLVAIILAGLALRLQTWRWHQLYPLGGDESEYFEQALTWLRGQGYHELQLMRPPMYPVFLAGIFRLFDSQVQRVRLAQALIGTGAIYLQWLHMRLASGPHERGQATRLIGTALIGLNFTLAANTTELLTETLFVCGLTLVLCLLLGTGLGRSPRGRGAAWLAGAAGIAAGILVLLRSVALPLLPLGTVWLFYSVASHPWWRIRRQTLIPALVFLVAGCAVIVPWTIRNYLRYGALIVVDTTGAENLWLDNDPAGRNAVKAQLYALGEDRAKRQALSTQRGIQAIRDDPGRFMSKAATEARKLVALEYWDDLRQRPAIWVPPLEVWARLLLGDGLWLILVLAGCAGFWYLRPRLLWLLAPWTLYIVVTSLMFHVELRYRLPLYPALALASSMSLTSQRKVQAGRGKVLQSIGSLLAPLLIVGLLLAHRPYLREGIMLVQKHWSLWRGDGAAALRADPSSALARVVLAKVPVRRCRAGEERECRGAERLLREAIEVKREHPYAHLLLGGLLRDRDEHEPARTELRYETSSLEDLQHWMVDNYGPRGMTRLDIGDGMDLGDITGFYPADDGARWTTGKATAWLKVPVGSSELQMRLKSGPGGSTSVRIHVPGMAPARVEVSRDWQIYQVSLPVAKARILQNIIITAETVRPRALDPASDDNRPLGVNVDWIEIADAK